MKQLLFSLFLLVALIACHHSNRDVSEPTPAEKDSIAAAGRFFPVPDFIGGQMKMIDSLRLPLTKSVTINNKTTLQAISDEEFRALAKNFQQPDINDSLLRPLYKSFNIADQSIPSVTLIYTALQPGLPLREINIFVRPDPVNNEKVNAVYMVKSFIQNDTVINQKLYWKTDKNFQITTERQFHQKTLPIQQVKVIWDPTD